MAKLQTVPSASPADVAVFRQFGLEGVGVPDAPRPGQDWLAIIMQPTHNKFATAFVAEPELVAPMVALTITGVAAMRLFFAATLAMFDHVDFTTEHDVGRRTYLEWKGGYRGEPVAGVTILDRDAAGAIKRVRLFYHPFGELVTFAEELTERLLTFASRAPRYAP